MTLLDEVIERLRALPADEQEGVAEQVLAIVEQHEAPSRLTPEQIEEVRQTMIGLGDGTIKVASNEKVEAMWRRLGA